MQTKGDNWWEIIIFLYGNADKIRNNQVSSIVYY